MVADALAAHLAVHVASDPIGCECPKSETCSRSQSGLLFHTSTGRPFDHDHYSSRVFLKAVRAAKLPTGTSTHDLRHHYASVLQMSGVAWDASFSKICELLLPATSSFRLDQGRLAQSWAHAS
ncbi:MAG: hypothetical protein ACRDUV_00925 [Pseudonocardiaceae bacterium]